MQPSRVTQTAQPQTPLHDQWDVLVGAAREAKLASEKEPRVGGPSEVFSFVRVLRSRPWKSGGKVWNPTADQALDHVYQVAAAAEIDDVWSELDLETHSGDPDADFLDAWDRVRLPMGWDFWAAVRAEAKKLHLVPMAHKRSKKYREFLALVWALHRIKSDRQDLYLPVRRIGKEIGVSEKMVTTFRRWAEAERFISTKTRSTGRMATRYTVHPEVFSTDGRQFQGAA